MKEKTSLWENLQRNQENKLEKNQGIKQTFQYS